MKRPSILLFTLALASLGMAQTRPDEHAAHHPPEAPAAKAPATAAAAVGQMPQSMKDMQALMDRIEKTRDPQERKRLLGLHREAMHAQLQSMQRMGMQGGMMECQEMMQGRMAMMSAMMDQMMRHEDAEQAPHK